MRLCKIAPLLIAAPVFLSACASMGEDLPQVPANAV